MRRFLAVGVLSDRQRAAQESQNDKESYHMDALEVIGESSEFFAPVTTKVDVVILKDQKR